MIDKAWDAKIFSKECHDYTFELIDCSKVYEIKNYSTREKCSAGSAVFVAITIEMQTG